MSDIKTDLSFGNILAARTSRPFSESWAFKDSGSWGYSMSLGSLFNVVRGKIQLEKLRILDQRVNEGSISARDNLLELGKSLLDHLNPNVIKYVVDELKKQRGDIHALDLMGYGGILRDLGISGAAVALSDQRSTGDHIADDWKKRAFIQGNILIPSTWKKIQQYNDSSIGGKGFDIIFCRPLGGIHAIPHDPGTYASIFQRSYNLLTKNDGIFATEVHPDTMDFIREASISLRKIPGIGAWSFMNTFLLIKGTNALDRLPKIKL